MKPRQQSPDDALPLVPREAQDDADTELDAQLDELDAIEAARRLADPNEKFLPFDPADYD